MSDTEDKDKDVSCFTVDGVVAEMVIEVEENQKVGSDDSKDLSSSPSKDDKKKEDSDGAVADKEQENEVEPLDTEENENEENSMEISETQDKNEEHKEDEKPEEVTDHAVEDTKCDEINQNVEDTKCDEINQNVEESAEINDSSAEEKNSNDGVNQPSIKNNQNVKRKRKRELSGNSDEINSSGTELKNSNDDVNQPSIKNNENINRKRKRELNMNSDENNDSKEEDMPRYPVVKIKKTEVDFKEKEEVKDNAVAVSSKKSAKMEEQNVSTAEEPDSSKKPEQTNLSRSLRRRKTETEDEKPASKQNVLRKLPFRKNKDAPDVPDLKPNVLWYNGVGIGQGVKLGDIPEIKERIKKAKSIRALYRVLFFQWPTNGQDLIGEILQFNGFPFEKSSYEYFKRQSIMKIMLDKTIFYMCELLDIRKGDKASNIKNILEFLMRPYAKIDPAQDSSWQPVVVLERLELESPSNVKLRRGRSLSSSKNQKEKDAKSTSVSSIRSTRSSGPRKIELVLYPEPEKEKEVVKSNKAKLSTPKESSRSGAKPVVKGTTPAAKDSKANSKSGMKKGNSESGLKDVKIKASPIVKIEKIKTPPVVKDTKEKAAPPKKDIKPLPKKENSKTEEIKKNESNKLKSRQRFKKRKKISAAPSSKKVPIKKESANDQSKEDSDEYEIEMTVDSGPDMDEDIEMKDADVKKTEPETVKTAQTKSKVSSNITEKIHNTTLSLSDSSETESAEETKLFTSAKRTPKVMIRKGKPLRYFPKISDSIQRADFTSLQRLHILLFGASDKAENLKSNILSFGGFPFLEGSDEWKQKHFLLSLLAQNNLREYLKLLCIPYGNDDQPTMINKLMRFLAVPNEESLDVVPSRIHDIETEVVSSVLVDKSSPVSTKGKVETKKKLVKKKEEKKISKRPRKVLMSEEEARRLESNFAREQRALQREKKVLDSYPLIAQRMPQIPSAPSLNMHNYAPQPKTSVKTPPTTDPAQLNALLQTVYKRRALKDAGAVVSTPNKGEKTKLGDIENVKFLIVTSNFSDLEILHRLIFMLEASKSRIRKNILDFEGFGFNEFSPNYRNRMDYLQRLGYDASKRISFLLGLCPLNTNIPQQDLNELIMYFLMSPCKSKQTVPITQMPEQPHIIVKSTAPMDNPIYFENISMATPMSSSINTEISQASSDKINFQHSTPLLKTSTQKARKTFPSSSKISPVKRILLPPTKSPLLGVSSLANKPQKMTLLNSVPAVPSYTLPKSTASSQLSNVTILNTGGIILNPPKSSANSIVKLPIVNPGSKIQILNPGTKAAVTDPSAVKSPLSLSNVLQNQVLIPQIANKTNVQSPQVQTPMMHGSKMVVKPPTGVASPSEFIVQQQTPDGQQKTFKLIRLPPNHPLISNGANKTPVQQVVSPSQLPQQVVLTNAPLPGNLPPGLVIMKNSAGVPQVIQNAPVKFLSLSTAGTSVSPVVSGSLPKNTLPQVEEIVSSSPDRRESASASANTLDNSTESISSSEDHPPTDEDLFSSIQEIILSSNFEDITLRNVIERVAAQYSSYDLTHRHNYMKECVKKIIIGT